ncbi:serine protease grass-like [Drosophila guanche]|uniref:CLIP domain-containing serine protease n=1 Tax=Drosophila guanche TaxID=7266 RepID=A0A3B0JHJ8_DROGU|nr:serine protease grass-like [Drosophila guanche]SPP72716.1 blast:Serine protease easter [Drosophila guanche]
MIGRLWSCLTLCLLAALIGSGQEARLNADFCSNFEDRPGRCIHYQRCPPIKAIVQRKRAGYELTQREPTFVCCEEEINDTGLAMLRNETECGKFSLAKVAHGQEVKMGSRPWMALLRYEGMAEGRSQFQCGATLISKRFILTAAHCMSREKPVSIRLGEHDLSTEVDCTMVGVGSQTRCQPPPEDIGIDRIIVHEGFPNNLTQNDIALIKLNRDVEYAAHINPICLPLNQQLQRDVRDQLVYRVTGWGRTESNAYSNVPREASVNRLLLQDCVAAYPRNAFAENQICTSSASQDSCSGDSGGPLLYAFRYFGQQRFVQTGIISYGPSQCGVGSSPGVYTDVGAFLPWITKQMAQA